jgi:hypothetical protein
VAGFRHPGFSAGAGFRANFAAQSFDSAYDRNLFRVSLGAIVGNKPAQCHILNESLFNRERDSIAHYEFKWSIVLNAAMDQYGCLCPA